MKSTSKFRKIDPNTIVLLKQIIVGVFFIALTVGLLTSIWHGTRAESVTLVEVEVVGGQTINHAEVRARALAQLDGQYASFIPRRFAWLYPQEDIAEAVAEVRRIHSIEVSRLSGKKLQVTFEEYLPDALWCADLEGNDCVFLDEAGYAYAPSPQLDGGSFLRFVHTSEQPTVASSLVIESDYALLKQLAGLLSDQGWFISHIEIDAVRDAFLHIVGGGEFKVTLTQSPEQTVDNLLVVLTSEEFIDIQPGTFQYIDLRFGNKVFVNEESPELLLELDADEEIADSERVEETETATSSNNAAGE